MELVDKVGMGASAHDKLQTHDDFDVCLDKQVVRSLSTSTWQMSTENPDKISSQAVPARLRRPLLQRLMLPSLPPHKSRMTLKTSSLMPPPFPFGFRIQLRGGSASAANHTKEMACGVTQAQRAGTAHGRTPGRSDESTIEASQGCTAKKTGSAKVKRSTVCIALAPRRKRRRRGSRGQPNSAAEAWQGPSSGPEQGGMP